MDYSLTPSSERAMPPNSSELEASQEPENQSGFRWEFLSILTCAIAGVFAWHYKELNQLTPAYALFALAFLAGGWIPGQKFIHTVAQKEFNVDLLMILAAVGAVLIGHPEEGVVLLFLFSLAEVLESYTMSRTAHAIESLAKLRPTHVTLIKSGQEVRVPLSEVYVGDIAQIRPAERLGVDGLIRSGNSYLDESTLTGEALPVAKGPGQAVFSGTLNHRGSLQVEVTCTSEETMLAKIVAKVKSAQEEKSQLEHRIAGWEQPYTLLVIAGTALVFLFSFFWSDMDSARSAYHAMVFLVAASPCAIVISTPAAMLAGIGRAARHGILFKGGKSLEGLAQIRAIGLDKTGTITHGKPEVTEVFAHPPSPSAPDILLSRAASLEHHSEHPLGHAIVRAAKEKQLTLETINDFNSIVGKGIQGTRNGVWMGAGNEQLFKQKEIPLPAILLEKAQAMRSRGMMTVLIYAGPELQGIIGITDTIRPEAKGVVQRLRKFGIRSVEILTGDHQQVAHHMRTQVGADAALAELLPEDKVKEIQRMMQEHGHTAFVGDGVNDAPALSTANVSFAMGAAGTDVALDAADVVLMKDDLRGLNLALHLSHRTRAAIRRGLAIALISIVINVTSALLGIIPLWLVVLIHEGSTVLAIISGLLLLVERIPESVLEPSVDG